MAKTTTTRALKNETTETDRALVIIDFGNGRVKVKVKTPSAKGWKNFSFPSFVAEAKTVNKHCLTIVTESGLKNYLVGEKAASIACARVGSSAGRKAEVADLLFLHALREAFGTPESEIHADVIFTAPSVAQYGNEMSAKLIKTHHVQIPASQYVPGSTVKNYVVNVHRAEAMLEGHLAGSELGIKKPTWLMDIGNRTINLTLVDKDLDIMARRPFDSCGVYSIADRIVSGELLQGLMKKTPSPQEVIDFLLGTDSHKQVVADEIAPVIEACVAEAMAYIADQEMEREADLAPVILIGGGAKLPGIAERLNATVAKNPDTANIDGIAKLAKEILGDA